MENAERMFIFRIVWSIEIYLFAIKRIFALFNVIVLIAMMIYNGQFFFVVIQSHVWTFVNKRH